MRVGSGSSFSGEERVCRVCGQSYPANSPTCPRCGYTPASSAPDVEGGWKHKIPLPARPRVSRIAATVLVTGLVLPVAAGVLLLLSFSDGLVGEDGVERRGSAGPRQGGPGRPELRCEQTMKRYLRDLSGAFGKANATAALFIEASNDLGPGSTRYRALIDVYGDVKVNSLMAKGRTGRAVRRAGPQIRAACAR